MLVPPVHPMFNGCYVYGPYFNKTKGRFFVQIKDGTGCKTLMSHSKYIWINAFGLLPDGCEIDHINGDRTDDSISNLQCIPAEQNQAKYQSSRTTLYVHLKCPWCEIEFIRPHATSHLGYGKSERGVLYSCCSKSCNMHIRNTYKGYSRLEFEGNVIRTFTAAPPVNIKEYLDGTR